MCHSMECTHCSSRRLFLVSCAAQAAFLSQAAVCRTLSQKLMAAQHTVRSLLLLTDHEHKYLVCCPTPHDFEHTVHPDHASGKKKPEAREKYRAINISPTKSAQPHEPTQNTRWVVWNVCLHVSLQSIGHVRLVWSSVAAGQ